MSAPPDSLIHIIYTLARWLHMIGSTLLIGGTLFYEFVIPIAIEDLKPELQLIVVGRTRWVFRKVVYFSVIVLILTGVTSTFRQWNDYTVLFPPARPWWATHVGLGIIAMAIALRLTIGRHVPPIRWMRFNLGLLLVVVFLASASRHVQMTMREPNDRDNPPPPIHIVPPITGRPTPDRGLGMGPADETTLTEATPTRRMP
jgi:hypothetical protein